jgi:hypothetical protein
MRALDQKTHIPGAKLWYRLWPWNWRRRFGANIDIEDIKIKIRKVRVFTDCTSKKTQSDTAAEGPESIKDISD